MRKLIAGIILILSGFNAQAAVITHGGTLPDSSQKSDFYAIIDSATISGIVNADISSSAAIVASKLDLSSPGTIGNTAPNTGRFTTLTTSGNVGVNSATPGQTLDVSGTIRATNFTGPGGNVGIGSTSPGSALDVQGTVRVLGSGNVGIGTATPASTLDVTGDIVGNGATWQDYSATSTVTGWASFTTKAIYYKRIGKTLFVSYNLQGTSNSTSSSFTLPFTSATGTTSNIVGICKDNSVYIQAPCEIDIGATTTAYPAMGGGNWTNTGTKIVTGEFWYQTT